MMIVQGYAGGEVKAWYSGWLRLHETTLGNCTTMLFDEASVTTNVTKCEITASPPVKCTVCVYSNDWIGGNTHIIFRRVCVDSCPSAPVCS